MTLGAFCIGNWFESGLCFRRSQKIVHPLTITQPYRITIHKQLLITPSCSPTCDSTDGLGVHFRSQSINKIRNELVGDLVALFDNELKVQKSARTFKHLLDFFLCLVAQQLVSSLLHHIFAGVADAGRIFRVFFVDPMGLNAVLGCVTTSGRAVTLRW